MIIKEKIFVHQEEVYNTGSAEIIVPILSSLFKTSSVLDIGCGLGTWLKIFQESGVKDVLGIESAYMDMEKLVISKNKVIIHDLQKPLNLKRKFDLVVCLEVAEHLPESAADIFIRSITSHGNIILFSSAIPNQGGQNHINEQWPGYWQKKFKALGYVYYDMIRPYIWENEKVDLWYKQNIFLVIHESMNFDHPKYLGNDPIHPKYWNYRINNLEEEIKKCKNEIDHLNDSLWWLEEHLNHWRNGNMGIRIYLFQLGKAILNKIRKTLFFSWVLL
ncbi:methyltransferase domain-containing protein [Cyclobacterium salsum]|uniref:methyltransferase domain-containing protein n=1 Tax=Cyclobacterium salsum TaxID=2666329 RepID=UPI0013908D0C|nr:methyltransferase domain-containing protein [Cyclobacterium salsum]